MNRTFKLLIATCTLAVASSIGHQANAQANIAGWFQNSNIPPFNPGVGPATRVHNTDVPSINTSYVSAASAMAAGPGVSFAKYTSAVGWATFYAVGNVSSCNFDQARANNDYITATVTIAGGAPPIRISQLAYTVFKGDGVASGKYAMGITMTDLTANTAEQVVLDQSPVNEPGSSQTASSIPQPPASNALYLIPGHQYRFKWYIFSITMRGCITVNSNCTTSPSARTVSCNTNQTIAVDNPIIRVSDVPPITTSGTVYNDHDGNTNGISNLSGAQVSGLNAVLVDAAGNVVAVSAVNPSTGDYSFTNINPVQSTSFYVMLSTGNPVVGTAAPTTASLPATWISTGENNGAGSGTDGTINGISAPFTPAGDVTNINFGINQAPVTVSDLLANQPVGAAASVPNVLSNDSDPNGGALLPGNINLIIPGGATGVTTDGEGDVVGFMVPGQGTWVLNADGSVTFTPASGFTADPTPIEYTVKDAAGQVSNQSTVTIDYNATTPPVANDNSVSNQAPGTSATLPTITANDTDADGTINAATVNLIVPTSMPAATGTDTDSDGDIDRLTVPGQGVWTVAPDGTVIFVPEAGFIGNPAPINYTVKDDAGLTSNQATLTVDYLALVSDYGDFPYSGATVNYPKVKAAFTDADNNNVPDDAGAVWLGTLVDGEADGFTNPADPTDYGKGDDKSGVADEDGLKVNGLMQAGTSTWTITANSNQPGTVHYGLWLDWGTPTTTPDGTFDDFYSGTITTASPASQAVSIAVPPTFLNGALVNARLIVSPSALDQATGFSTDLANGEIEDYQFSFDGAMPVRLVSFQAKAMETDVQLDWKATEQENFDRYEVERSLDGKNFGKIGEVASNNQATGTYAYSDRAAAGYGSQLYYRLKMVDRAADRTDGSFSYSVMRSVRFGDALTGIIYPNPVADRIYFRVSDWNLVKSVTIYNLAGLQVYSSGPVASGVVDASGLGSGMHILQIHYKDGSFRTQKFVRFK